jgi:type II secretory pathway pseudopilin PulG
MARVITTPIRAALTLLELVVVMGVLAAMAGIATQLFTGINGQAAGTATFKSLRTVQNIILNSYVPNMKNADISAGQQMPAPIDLDGLPRSSVTGQPMLTWLFQNPALTYGLHPAAVNPATGLGWNGPYLASGLGYYPGANASPASRGFANGTYGNNGDPTVLDGWGNPIVIVAVTDQNSLSYYILLSAGPSGVLNLTSDSGDGTVHITFNSDPTANPTGQFATVIGGTNYQYWIPLR